MDKHKVMIDYSKTTKLRTCLKCSKVFTSLHAGNRICEDHKYDNNYYQPDTWGDNMGDGVFIGRSQIKYLINGNRGKHE
jgi:hypothetical protein